MSIDKDKHEAWEKVVYFTNEGDIEEMLKALGNYFTVDASKEKHPVVVSILEGLSETMHKASLDYYCSLK